METDNEQSKFLFATSALDIAKAEEGKKRTFKGTAYAGGRVDGHWFWGRSGVVFDLEGIEIPTPTPLLGEHFSTSRVGVVNQVNINNGIQVEGNFLSNPEAQQFTQDSDDGFPFQMSMFIDPGSIEEVLQGQTVTVNGQSFTGPIAVFRNNRIREFTICSTGADRNTSIKAFSGKPNLNQPKEDTDVTELEQTKEALKKAETERDNAQAELKQFKAQKRAEDIASLEAELKTQFSAEDKTAYTNMDDSVFAFTAKQLRQFSAGIQQQPPADQQQQQAPLANPAFAHLFTHQANPQSGTQPSGNQEHRLSAGAKAFAAQQKGK